MVVSNVSPPEFRQDVETLKSTLEQLQKIAIDKHILQADICSFKVTRKCRQTADSDPVQQTKVGRIVNKLRKHANSAVSALAAKIVAEWKSFVAVSNI